MLELPLQTATDRASGRRVNWYKAGGAIYVRHSHFHIWLQVQPEEFLRCYRV
jgi:hypothetical protein